MSSNQKATCIDYIDYCYRRGYLLYKHIPSAKAEAKEFTRRLQRQGPGPDLPKENDNMTVGEFAKMLDGGHMSDEEVEKINNITVEELDQILRKLERNLTKRTPPLCE